MVQAINSLEYNYYYTYDNFCIMYNVQDYRVLYNNAVRQDFMLGLAFYRHGESTSMTTSFHIIISLKCLCQARKASSHVYVSIVTTRPFSLPFQ